MSIPLNRDKRKNTGCLIGDFCWDGALKSFAWLRLDTAYAVPTGEKRRPTGFREKLAAELNAFAQRYKIPLPSGTHFVASMVKQRNRDADSERKEKYKAVELIR